MYLYFKAIANSCIIHMMLNVRVFIRRKFLIFIGIYYIYILFLSILLSDQELHITIWHFVNQQFSNMLVDSKVTVIIKIFFIILTYLIVRKASSLI